MIRFVAPLIFALLLLVGCATAPEEEVPDAEDTALAAPEARRRIEDAAEPVPEAEARVVSPRDRYIMLELAQAPAAAAVEVRITGENGTDPLRLDRYSVEAGGVVRVPTA